MKDPRPKLVKLIEEFPELELSLQDAVATACTSLRCVRAKKGDVDCKFCGAALPTLSSLIERWSIAGMDHTAKGADREAGVLSSCIADLVEVMEYL